MKYCPNCNKHIEDDAQRFCAVCGTPLIEKNICPKCNTENSPEYAFCIKCGAPLKNNQNIPSQTSTSINNPVEKTNNDNTKLIIIATTVVAIAGLAFYFFSGSHNQNNVASKVSEPQKNTTQLHQQKQNKNNSVINKDIDSSTNSKTDTNVTSKKKGIITGTEVFMRSGPGTQFKSVGVFEKGDFVDILEVQQGWFKVQTSNNGIVWVNNRYCSENLSSHKVPHTEMAIGDVILGKSLLKDVKRIYGEPTQIKVSAPYEIKSVAYLYGSNFTVRGLTWTFRKDPDENCAVYGCSIRANNLSTPSGFRVGMPYQKVVEMYGEGEKSHNESQGNIYTYKCDKKIEWLSFTVNDNGIITEISMSKEW